MGNLIAIERFHMVGVVLWGGRPGELGKLNSVLLLPIFEMSDRIINGNTISADIRAELKAEVEKIKAEGLTVPGLVVILVGDRTDSATYVRMKEKACQEIGFNSTLLKFPASTSQEEVVARCMWTAFRQFLRFIDD